MRVFTSINSNDTASGAYLECLLISDVCFYLEIYIAIYVYSQGAMDIQISVTF